MEEDSPLETIVDIGSVKLISPVLDEHFSVNTSKQQIIPNERFLDTLEKTDIFKILNKIERAYYEENDYLKEKLKFQNSLMILRKDNLRLTQKKLL